MPIARRRTTRRWPLTVALVTAALATLYAGSFAWDYSALWRRPDPLLADDYARLTPTRVARATQAADVAELQAVLADARARNLKVAISGSRHSQGGHTYTANGVALNMRRFNRVLAIDTVQRTVTVQSGATWDEVQRALAPRGLAIKVMQSSNIFTVGGTMSANAHGRDLDVMQMVDVVQRFGLLMADGRVVEVSRTDNPELFGLVIGGYGMYGIILDVTLRVTRDVLYEQRATTVDYRAFPAFFADTVQRDTAIALMLVRPSIDPNPASFLKDLVVVTWRNAPAATPASFALTEEANVARDRFFLGISRKADWAKTLRWKLQTRVELGAGTRRIMSRNNAMRPPLAPLELLEYHSSRDTDIIQEYYVPVRHFVPFMDRFRQILVEGKMNVLSATVRYVKPDSSLALGYAPREPVFAIIHMSNVGFSTSAQAHAAEVTRQLVDAAAEFGGSYYLTYQNYPTPAQLHRAYPKAAWAFERKRFYDPEERFSSRFYETYGHTTP
jgi:decaprenylphospho-beta-D-ribofuranose 2-oxidase